MTQPLRALVAAALAALLPACLPSPAAEPPPAPLAERLAALDAELEQALPAWKVPGMAVAVVKDGEIVHARGFGVRETGRPEPVDENTVFSIASMTKPFTATAVALLVAEGKLGWDDRVVDRLPGFALADPAATAEIRLRDLLSHRGGYETFAGDLVWINSRLDGDEVLRRLRFVPAAWGLRYRYGYSNLLFLTAGKVLEAVAGMTWGEFVRARFLAPLGMSRTTINAAERDALDNLAVPHMEVDGALHPLPQFSMDNTAPAGALASSASDLARWIRMLLADGTVDGIPYVPAAALAETRAPHTPIPLTDAHRRWVPFRHLMSYGLGWYLFDYRGRLALVHDGGVPGTFSVMMLVPEEQLGVVVLCNAETMLTRATAYRFLDLFLGAEPFDWSAHFLQLLRDEEAAAEAEAAAAPAAETPAAPPTLPLSAYAGRYRNNLLGPAELREAEGGLAISVPEHGDLEGRLVPHDGDVFLCTWSDPVFGESLVAFELDGGRVVRLRFAVRPDFVDPLEHVFEREPEAPAGP